MITWEYVVKPVQRIGIAVAALVLVGGVSACGSGRDAYTQKWYNPAEGINADAGDVDVRDLVVVTNGEGAVSVVGTFINQGDDDRLVEVMVDGQQAELSPRAVELPSGSPVHLGQGDTRADVSGLSDGAVPGTGAEVELRFQSAPRTTVSTYVYEAEGIYDDLGPTAQPTAVAEG